MPLKCIITRYHPPTANRNQRLSARALDCKTRYFKYNYGARDEGGRMDAANIYAATMGWGRVLSSGRLPNGDVVFTLAGSECE